MMQSATKRRLAALLAALLLLCGCTTKQESEQATKTTASMVMSTAVATSVATTNYGAPDTPYPTEMRLRVTGLSQFPLYPTGCESVTAVMALRHAGEPVTVEDYQRIVGALQNMGMLSAAEKVCDKVIEEYDGAATAFAHYTKGIFMLHDNISLHLFIKFVWQVYFNTYYF